MTFDLAFFCKAALWTSTFLYVTSPSMEKTSMEMILSELIRINSQVNELRGEFNELRAEYRTKTRVHEENRFFSKNETEIHDLEPILKSFSEKIARYYGASPRFFEQRKQKISL